MLGNALRPLGGVCAIAAALLLSACWPWSTPVPKATATAPAQIGTPGSAFPGPPTRVTNGQASVDVFKVGPDTWAYVVAQTTPNTAKLLTSVTVIGTGFPASKCPVAAAEWATPAASPVPWTATPSAIGDRVALAPPASGAGSAGAASVGVTIGGCDFKNTTALYFQVGFTGGSTTQIGPTAGPSDK